MINKSIDFVFQHCVHCQYHRYELSQNKGYLHKCSRQYSINEGQISEVQCDVKNSDKLR